jgi:hypothetical protein
MISWVAMDRMVERKMAEDAECREKVADKPMRSRARYLTDGELLDKLRSFGVEMYRASLGRLCKEFLSAEEMARPLIVKCGFKTTKEEVEGDWIWVCLDALWRRWFPDEPSFETLDDKMQAGYELNSSRNVEAACRIWLEAWDDVMRLFDKAEVYSIREFDERFLGTQSLFNWVQDLKTELWNAGLRNRGFFAKRVVVCEAGADESSRSAAANSVKFGATGRLC